eukprot:GEMP01044298.1.p1 GENE.GEMP01044298.1~~GEMP01044298.1.p1  ORF type:complete len:214 (+),score=32.31 GEMP01044298.1:596-1237(+)
MSKKDDKETSNIQDQISAGLSYGSQVALEAGAKYGSQGLSELNRIVQTGPAGVSFLSFFGGIATAVVGAIGVFSFDISSPFVYLLNIYLILFGVVTILLEADPEFLLRIRVFSKLVPHVEKYQKVVNDLAKFLTGLRGRGAFYVFVGTLCITECFLCLLSLAGMWNIFLGVLCILFSFGVKPDISPEAFQSAKNRTSVLLNRHGSDYQPVSQH